MSDLVLYVGNKNYSSWSFRPWIALEATGVPFTDRVIPFDFAAGNPEIRKVSPTGKVPVLHHGDVKVWESLAICEYASELAGGAGWPRDMRLRALARAAASEMHSGFTALRAACPMNARATGRRVPMTPALARDLARVDALWSGCRRDQGELGPWLFGQFSVADAMYAPIALRVRTYGLPLSSLASLYLDTVLGDRHVAEWIDAARRETRVIPHEEAGAGA